MAKKKIAPKVQKTTLFVMGEGECDKAFLEHFKSLYNERNSGKKITIDHAGGGSPHDVIKYTKKVTQHIGYDNIYILIDSDVEVKNDDLSIANEKGFIILYSKPICLEGMLLKVLNQSIPNTNNDCKNKLYPQLSGNPTQKESYSPLFDKPVLDNSNHETIIQLKTILGKSN